MASLSPPRPPKRGAQPQTYIPGIGSVILNEDEESPFARAGRVAGRYRKAGGGIRPPVEEQSHPPLQDPNDGFPDTWTQDQFRPFQPAIDGFPVHQLGLTQGRPEGHVDPTWGVPQGLQENPLLQDTFSPHTFDQRFNAVYDQPQYQVQDLGIQSNYVDRNFPRSDEQFIGYNPIPQSFDESPPATFNERFGEWGGGGEEQEGDGPRNSGPQIALMMPFPSVFDPRFHQQQPQMTNNPQSYGIFGGGGGPVAPGPAPLNPQIYNTPPLPNYSPAPMIGHGAFVPGVGGGFLPASNWV